MELILRGKFLIRKTKLDSGKSALIVTGAAFVNSDNFYDTIDDNDEMWVCDLTLLPGGIRFSNRVDIKAGSPEDFLMGQSQSPSAWKKRTDL